MKFSILVDNKTERADCCAEWGLSILIESRGEKILLDTGMSPMFAENAKAMGIDLSDVSALVISHGHFDHTGGAETFADINRDAPIYVHKDALYTTYGEVDGVMDDYTCGILWDDALRRKLQPRIRFTSHKQQIGDHVWVVVNIPSMKEYPPTENFFRRLNIKGAALDGRLAVEPDPMDHEQFIAVEEEGRLHVFSGCSHKGIIPTLRFAMQLFPDYPIAGFTAGMHLHAVSANKRSEIIDALAAMNLDYVVPLHCTGMKAIVEMKMKMGDRCKIMTGGQTVSI